VDKGYFLHETEDSYPRPIRCVNLYKEIFMAEKKNGSAASSTERYQVKKSSPKSGKKTSKSTSVTIAKNKNNSPEKGSGKRKNTAADKRTAIEEDRRQRSRGMFTQIFPYFLSVLAILLFVAVCWKNAVGVVGLGLHYLFFGLFGTASYVIPVFLLLHAFMWRRDVEENRLVSKIVTSAVAILLLSVLIHTFSTWSGINAGNAESFKIVLHWENGVGKVGGGVFGGMIGAVMIWAFAKAGTLIISFAAVILLVMLFLGITPRTVWLWCAYQIKRAKERKEERRIAEAEKMLREPAKDQKVYEYNNRSLPSEKEADRGAVVQISLPTEAPVKRQKRAFEPDVPVDEPVAVVPEEEEISVEPDAEVQQPDENLIDEKLFDEIMARTMRRGEKSGSVTEADLAGSRMAEPLPVEVVAPPANVEVPLPKEEILSPVYSAEEADGDEPDLSDIFVDPEDKLLIDRLTEAYLKGNQSEISTENEKGGNSPSAELEITVERRTMTEAPPPPPPKPKRRDNYRYPPLSLLYEDTSTKDENIKEELYDNASKLVETLRSFNVKTKIVDVSRGPTITRYELLPEAGTRVRSIANLVDDIALNLATSGVRIEAPIPGKAAVGIEVPNRNPSVVHLRTLLEDSRFADHKSNVCAALGEDVAGAVIYCDIAKMPHLLIAGATGMGKSVSINSIIVSLLYKSSPDDVRMILIDPKKVELSIYNGIPHLLTPVVSDPKKAAGSLAWAVAEMERRFGLIEEVGVRDIKAFNAITKDDPQYEYLPQIVIIIDELADLMMTAPDDVETSICRLAQKARAAGMHLIIGTQRPSVDVITGLIKANIPSRVAFTVASQIDSRTIIDRSGAENLIGRGDMLYSPVGAQKPLRVQGAFVSESDVEKVVAYIKETSGVAQYDNQVMEQIDAEAARCGNGKKGAAASGADSAPEGGAEDPMLRQALELAVDSGKISTSLIQRRLSLGYGRAAKLIDRLEQLGYVSAPDGQKPREVLLTKEQYMELVVKGVFDE